MSVTTFPKRTGVYSEISVKVAPATGIAATDRAAIEAAITSAGNGGIVEFPSNQTYVVSGRVGSSQAGVTIAYPRLFKGNGSTIKLRNQAATTTTSSVSSGATSVPVTDGTVFSIGEWITLSDDVGNRITPVQISNIVGNTLTVSAVAFDTGSSSPLASGSAVVASDHCLYIKWAAEYPVEITDLVFDGNLTNRTSGRTWLGANLLNLEGDGAGAYDAQVWIHHNTFQNAPNDAVVMTSVPNVEITDNRFDNIYGNGCHPGGSVNQKNYLCTNNTFYNVYQSTAATTPTATGYGHNNGSGAMVTSLGPRRTVISGNIVDTSKAYGCDAMLNSNVTDFAITGNVFYNCDWGGFRVASTGTRGTITGNIINTCGHETPVIASTQETTQVSADAASDVTIANNVFYNSVLAVVNDVSRVAVTGNVFNCITKAVGATYETAALVTKRTSTGLANTIIANNIFRGPRTAAEMTALSPTNTPMMGIIITQASNVSVTDNLIIGFRYGLYLNVGSSFGYSGIAIIGNNFLDQIDPGSGANAHAFIVDNPNAFKNINIANNVVAREAETSGSWVGMEFGATLAGSAAVNISGNTITTGVNPTAQTGFKFNTNAMAGFHVNGNYVRLNNGASGTAISAASAGAGAVIVNNVWANSNVASIGASAVVASANQSLTI